MKEGCDALAQRLGRQLRQQGLRLATAESCTGGWVAKVITDIPGSSDWFDRGFVTYSNEAKRDMLGVSANTLERYGAVSEETVAAMVRGVLNRSPVQVALAVSGIAGPGGAMEKKPVGTVCFAWALPEREIQVRRVQFAGDREEVRHQSVRLVLEQLLESLEAHD